MEIRTRYKELFEEQGKALGLPASVPSRQGVEANMEEWERANPSRCELSAVDARHLHGAVGTSLLASRFRYVLVRAAEQASEILEYGRGSALNRLLSAVEELGDAKKQPRIGGYRSGGVMLAIEEPELYQHPLQARALAASLGALTTGQSPPIQVAYSTHSPYFTSPALFGRLRLCRRGGDGGTSCVAGDQREIEEAISAAGYQGDLAHKVAETLAQSLREAIFAHSVLLTEGPTDAAMLHGMADAQGGLDREGVAIAACGTKSNLGPAIVILKQLEIPFFVLFDSDADRGLEHSKELNRRLLALCDEPEEDWPRREVRQRSANFRDTLETDLAELWPAYDEARTAIARELGVKEDKKDPRAYRDAVAGAGEPPEFVLDVLDAARRLAS